MSGECNQSGASPSGSRRQRPLVEPSPQLAVTPSLPSSPPQLPRSLRRAEEIAQGLAIACVLVNAGHSTPPTPPTRPFSRQQQHQHLLLPSTQPMAAARDIPNDPGPKLSPDTDEEEEDKAFQPLRACRQSGRAFFPMMPKCG